MLARVAANFYRYRSHASLHRMNIDSPYITTQIAHDVCSVGYTCVSCHILQRIKLALSEIV